MFTELRQEVGRTGYWEKKLAAEKKEGESITLIQGRFRMLQSKKRVDALKYERKVKEMAAPEDEEECVWNGEFGEDYCGIQSEEGPEGAEERRREAKRRRAAPAPADGDGGVSYEEFVDAVVKFKNEIDEDWVAGLKSTDGLVFQGDPSRSLGPMLKKSVD